MNAVPGVPGSSDGPPLIAALSRRPAWLVPAIDGLVVALVVALFGALSSDDPTVHAIFALLVVRAFVVAVLWTWLSVVAMTVVLVVYSVIPESDPPTAPELSEWLVMFALVGVVAVLAGRLERAARHFSALYHEATERLVTSQEEQRRRLAQELHDGVGQGIGALLLQLDTVGGRVAGDPPTAALVESARELTASVLDEVRGVALQLHPAIAHPAGLAGALRALADHAGARVDLVLDPLVRPGVLSPLAESALYRIVQEALANAVRHSHGVHVRVTVELVGSEVHASIADDGVGFSVAQATGRGIGLLAMQERATRAGGTVIVETEPGRGTVVAVTLPRADGGRMIGGPRSGGPAAVEQRAGAPPVADRSAAEQPAGAPGAAERAAGSAPTLAGYER